MGNFFSYMRISTKEERGLQKYSRQASSIQRYVKDHSIDLLLSFQEDASGRDFINRPEWLRLERILQPGDTVIFKDISRFTRDATCGYDKYMELFHKGIDLFFIDNPTVSTDYIKNLLDVAARHSLVARTSLEGTVKLLLIVELDRAEQERLILINRIKNGIAASEKRQGRKPGSLDKLTDALQSDILLYLHDRSVTQADLIARHRISRNTLRKYISIVKEQNSINQLNGVD